MTPEQVERQNLTKFWKLCRSLEVGLVSFERGGDGRGKLFMQTLAWILMKYKRGKSVISCYGQVCIAAPEFSPFLYFPLLETLTFTCTICTGMLANLAAFFSMWASSTNILRWGADQSLNMGHSGSSQISIDLHIIHHPLLHHPFTNICIYIDLQIYVGKYVLTSSSSILFYVTRSQSSDTQCERRQQQSQGYLPGEEDLIFVLCCCYSLL